MDATDKQVMVSIKGFSLEIRVDNLSDAAKSLFELDQLRFAEDLLDALNADFKNTGLDVKFSDFRKKLIVSSKETDEKNPGKHTNGASDSDARNV